jgi:hypothetical protein
MDLISRFLTLIAWGGVGVLIFLLYRIAHFYQVTSGQPTRYRLFVIPLALLLLGGLRYAVVGDWNGDVIGNTLQLAGGAALIAMGVFVLRKMTGGRR